MRLRAAASRICSGAFTRALKMEGGVGDWMAF